MVGNCVSRSSSESSLAEGPLGSNEGSSCDQALAFKKILVWVKVRDRSVKETRDRLIRGGFKSDSVERAIEQALHYQILDDQRFADSLVRSRLRQGKGLDGVVRELRGHNIAVKTLLPGFPDEYLAGRPSQEDCAYALLCRKPPRAKNARQAAYAKLVRAGYPMALSAEVASKWFCAMESGK